MARVFINHPVSDYDTWRPAFDSDQPRRTAAGLTDVAVLRDADDPNSVWIVFEGAREAAGAMLANLELGNVMQEAGVTAPPEYWVA
jgi:hypothetical protein